MSIESKPWSETSPDADALLPDRHSTDSERLFTAAWDLSNGLKSAALIGTPALAENPRPVLISSTKLDRMDSLPYLALAGAEVADTRVRGDASPAGRGKPSALEQSRKGLLDVSKDVIKSVHGKYEPDYSKIFEKSIKEMEAGLKERNLSAKEATECMKCVKRVLGDSASTKLTPTERLNLARDLVKMFGDPTKTEQLGNTCTLNSLVVNMLWREPSKVGKLVADSVLTGKFTSKDGTVIKAPESVIHPPSGARPCAEHVAAAMAANVRWQRSQFGPTGKCNKGDVVYDPFALDAEGKRGERLLIAGKPFKGYWNPKTKSYSGGDSPSMGSSELPGLYEQIAGRRPEHLVASWGTAKSEGGTLHYKSPEDLGQKLGDLKKKAGGLPLIVSVDIRNPPFSSDSGYSAERPPSIASHVVNIIDYEYDPITKQGYVWVDNTWAKSKDHSGKKGESARLTIKELYDACREYRK